MNIYRIEGREAQNVTASSEASPMLTDALFIYMMRRNKNESLAFFHAGLYMAATEQPALGK